MNSNQILKRIERDESFLLANDGQYLGKLSLNRFDSESIFNEFGSFGSKFSSTSIWNTFSNYGSAFSSLSPFNKFTNTPPMIYLHGKKFGYLTKNKFLGLNSVSPDEIELWLKKQNLFY
jgi:hypothetical protein